MQYFVTLLPPNSQFVLHGQSIVCLFFSSLSLSLSVRFMLTNNCLPLLLLLLLFFAAAAEGCKGKGKGHPITGHEGPEGE
jgi:hypothetical protein